MIEETKRQVMGIVRVQYCSQVSQMADFKRHVRMRKVHLSAVVRRCCSKNLNDHNDGMCIECEVNDIAKRGYRRGRGWIWCAALVLWDEHTWYRNQAVDRTMCL